ncbi:MAG: GlsB/YeaQ/YmgE family stress response membrane protein, partial [Dehalococcoidia bacterium]|nr:GlsB/YeaQ/YmgE family stress response membrane protein [Dehalococcoidia bacterium]
LVGAVIGLIARILLPGKERMGWIMTIILGALGAFLAGSLGNWLGWYTFPSWIGFAAAIVVAMILIGLYSGAKRR